VAATPIPPAPAPAATPQAARTAEPPAAEPTPRVESVAEAEEDDVPADPVEGEAPAPAESEPVPADPTEEAEAAPAETEPAEAAQEPEPPARSSTGQVVANVQEAPTMDWEEALRTGAIPLPSVSRRSYSAPARTLKRDEAGPARFELRAVGRQRFEVVNVGAATAEQAVVEGIGDGRDLVTAAETDPAMVRPGAALGFSVLRVVGRKVSVRVSWVGAGGDPQSVELAVPGR
jgi:hypothetical protein